ncbi:MAG: glycosyltransferase family 39 protein [Chloroflexota bacterium]
MRNPLLILIILNLVIGASTLTRGHEWGDDFASYIMQAGSILSGTTHEFVEHNSFTIYKSSTQIGPVAYPWGYPLILTPIYAIKGISPLALKLPGLFFYGGFLACLYLLLNNRLTQSESLLGVSLFAFNPMLIRFLDQILSDIPFLFFSTLALLLMMNEKKYRLSEYILLGCVIACAFFIRTTGILLLASYFALKFSRAWSDRRDHESIRKNAWSTFIVGSVFAALWFAYALLFPGGGESYFAQYQDFQIQTAVGFIYQYFQVFNLFFGESILWKVLYPVLLMFFLSGAWIRRKEDKLFLVFFLLWLLLLITWPFWQGPRFIFPLLPIFIYFTFQGMKFTIAKMPEKYAQMGRWVFYGFWSLTIIFFLSSSSANAYANLQNDRSINGPFDSYSREVYRYIQEETAVNSVVVFFKPRAMRLMTGRDTIMSPECDRILEGNYLVLSRKVGENQQIPPEKIGDCNLPLVQVMKNTRFVVYEIQK